MITKPLRFEDAIAFLLNKEQLPAEWDAAMWQAQEPDFRTRAFWSANVENARFIDRAQTMIFDHLAGVKESITKPDGTNTEALSVFDRAHFVEKMREFMIAEGMFKKSDFRSVNQKDVTDIRSLARLNLIFDTNVRQAYGYGRWKQGVTPEVIKAFPAARLIRDRGVKQPRLRHEVHLGEVMLKTDSRWAEYHNDPKIGGFGVPWGPYGFNSGVTQEDVSREVAADMGLPINSESSDEGTGINNGLKSSVRGMDPELKRRLLEELRSGPPPLDAAAAGRDAARRVRRKTLTQGLEGAIQRGDKAMEAKYRKAISELSVDGLKVTDNGDSIRMD